jgi:L-2-hydroxyglutarate oxidase LhgO
VEGRDPSEVVEATRMVTGTDVDYGALTDNLLKHGGILQFGTELVGASDRSIVAMLGASPGASTAVSIMLRVIEQHFPEALRTGEWPARLTQMIPSYGQSLIDNPALCQQVRAETAAILNIDNINTENTNTEESSNDSRLSAVHRA